MPKRTKITNADLGFKRPSVKKAVSGAKRQAAKLAKGKKPS